MIFGFAKTWLPGTNHIYQDETNLHEFRKRDKVNGCGIDNRAWPVEEQKWPSAQKSYRCIQSTVRRNMKEQFLLVPPDVPGP